MLATRDDVAVGFATLYWVRQSTRARGMTLLNDLYVVPASRGGRRSGVGHALLTAAAEYAAKAGFEVLRHRSVLRLQRTKASSFFATP